MARHGSPSATGSPPPCRRRVTGLKASSSYLFRVSAINAAGAGAQVATAAALKPLAPTARLRRAA